MGTAIYVYETEKEYLKIYHRMDKEVMFSAPILDIFLKPDKKLWVVSKITKNKERPQLGRSIVNFVNGTVFEYSNGDERPILKNSVVFNPKRSRVVDKSRQVLWHASKRKGYFGPIKKIL